MYDDFAITHNLAFDPFDQQYDAEGQRVRQYRLDESTVFIGNPFQILKYSCPPYLNSLKVSSKVLEYQLDLLIRIYFSCKI